MSDPLEARLERLFAVDMPAALVARADARVNAVAAAGARSRRHPAPNLRRGLVLALVATFGLAAATIGALTLYERVAHLAPPGDEIAWERSVELGLSVETDAGTLTLARGYADANRVVLALGTSTQDVVSGSELRDAEGRTYVPLGGFGYAELSGESVMLESWLAPEPLPPGEIELTLSPHGAQAAWTLEFSLPVGGGVTLAPQLVADVRGVSVALERFSVSPTAVVAELQLGGLDAERAWATIGRVSHDGDASLTDGGIQSIEGIDDPMHQTTIVTTGADNPAGVWTVRIDELVGFDANGDQVRIAGPWEFTITVP
ncbi:MAG: hypothetical protein WD846_04515 [Patescibacteria group bacterium]